MHVALNVRPFASNALERALRLAPTSLNARSSLNALDRALNVRVCLARLEHLFFGYLVYDCFFIDKTQ